MPTSRSVSTSSSVSTATAPTAAASPWWPPSARIKEVGREADIKVTKTSCMGRCGEGPTVAVYPDGVWYRTVQADDASELVQEHLLNDRLVARLVDNILQ